MIRTKTSLLSLIFTLLCTPLLAQFEGSVIYKFSASGANADQVSAMLPQTMTMAFRDKQSYFNVEGGMAGSMMGKSVVKHDEGFSYTVKPNEQKIVKTPIDKDAAKENDSEVTPTGETEDIAGYLCKEHKVVSKAQGQTQITYIWATDEIEMPDAMTESTNGKQFGFGMVSGFPLRIVTPDAGAQQGMDFSLSIEVDKIKEGAPDEKLFTLPEDYEVTEKKASKSMQRGAGSN